LDLACLFTVIDSDALKKLVDLSLEREIRTDYDAVKLVEELGGNALKELQKRMRENEEKSST
jgi:predicted nucleotidyltransferase